MGLLDMLGEIIGLKPTPALSKCPLATGVIFIMVRRQGGDGAGIPGVKITLKGPSPGVVVTDSMGIAEFGDRDVGDYKFAADFSNPALKAWKNLPFQGDVSVAAGKVQFGEVQAYPTGTLIIRVFDDATPRRRVASKTAAAHSAGTLQTPYNNADLTLTVPAGTCSVAADALSADLYVDGRGAKDVVVPVGGTVIAEFILPILNTVTPGLDITQDGIWYLPPEPPPRPGEVAPPALAKELPSTLHLRLNETQPAKPYTGGGGLDFNGAHLQVYRSSNCSGLALASGARLSNAELKAGLTLYVKGVSRGSAHFKLALDPSGDPNIIVLPPVEKPVQVKEINVVEPKIALEYKVVLWDRGLSAHQKDDKGVVEPKLIFADATKIELSLTESSADAPYKKSGRLEANHCLVFKDEDCTQAQALDLAQPIAVETLSGASYALWLRGKTRGQFNLKLTLADPADPHIRLRPPASKGMGVVELKMELHEHDEAALINETFDDKKDTQALYFDELKGKKIPAQVAMSDAKKVWPGRLLHAQKSGSFGRAKLVVKKLDASQWPAGCDDYLIHLNRSVKSGAVALYAAETEGDPMTFPTPRAGQKVSALTADTTYWVEGGAVCSAWRDAELDLTLSRPEVSPDCSLVAEAKRHADWARFTVMKVKEIKLDYKAEADEANAWDSGENRFFVNLKDDPDGRKIKLVAEIEPKLEGVPIHFMLAPQKDNGLKANWGVDLPATWKWGAIEDGVKHKDRDAHNKLLHSTKKTNAEGKAEIEVTLSRFGGDIFEPGAYITQDPHLAKYVKDHTDLGKRKPVLASHTITVWKKFWYQEVKVTGIHVAGFGDSADTYKDVKIVMEAAPVVEMTLAAAKLLAPNPVRMKYQLSYYVDNNANKFVNNFPGDQTEGLMVGDNLQGTFFALAKPAKDKPVMKPVMNVHALWIADGVSGAKDMSWSQNLPKEVTMDKMSLSAPIQGDKLLAGGTWEAEDFDPAADGGKGAWINHRDGTLAPRDISINSNRSDPRSVTVDWPQALVRATKTRLRVNNLTIRGAKYFLGTSYNKGIINAYTPNDEQDFINTINHELGHSLGQTEKSPPAGAPNHPLQYDQDGSHCNYQNKSCVMYESGPQATSLNRYCPTCHPYVLSAKARFK